MRGLDTNVIVAWILDAPGSGQLPDEPPYRVSLVALAELAWVFDRVYKRPRDEIAGIVTLLTEAEGVQFESGDVVKSALLDYRTGSGDFADYLLMRDGEDGGCETTLTFDKKAARHPGFTLLRRN